MKRDFSLADFLKSHGYVGIEMARNVVGHFEVDARINGRPLRLLIDTGASGTVIDRESARRIQLETTPSEQKGGGVGTSQHAVELATLDSLEVASLHLTQVRVAIMELSHVSQSLISHGGQR